MKRDGAAGTEQLAPPRVVVEHLGQCGKFQRGTGSDDLRPARTWPAGRAGAPANNEMLLVIALVTGLSATVNRYLFRPGSRNAARPALIGSLAMVGWYVTLTAVVGIIAALVGLNGENGVATSTWIAWLVGGAVAIIGCVTALIYGVRR
ncbi:hypothetical protein [Luedemannella helvata]|uniref:hypothetical protein n=1 Tax=Luedemannella helvata TaxID=349315 RepID=UPI0031CE041A